MSMPGRSSVTVPDVMDRKVPTADPIVMVTAYDTPSATAADLAGVDIILVGDSLAMVVLGHEDTLNVGIAEMVHHTAAVSRARPRALVVTDMPWLSYHRGSSRAIKAAGKLIRAGAGAVKVEGRRPGLITKLVDCAIPVMGHLGLTPQSVHAMGGYKTQGRTEIHAQRLVEDAMEIAEAGCFAVVIEGVPAPVARVVTASVPVPVIGIGAGPDCDGQVLVLHDLVGLPGPKPAPVPRFVRAYADLGGAMKDAIAAFAADVRAGRFPDLSESYPGSSDLEIWSKAKEAGTLS